MIFNSLEKSPHRVDKSQHNKSYKEEIVNQTLQK